MKERITLERTYAAPIEDVWEMWTTKEGIESWWGPDGFRVEVRHLDLRPSGVLEYAMIAIAEPQQEFLRKAGMALVTENRLTFTEITAPRRLAYTHLADFIPGVAPYDVDILVELSTIGDSTHMRLTFDAMHDAHWTRMATMGWDNEIDRLALALKAA